MKDLRTLLVGAGGAILCLLALALSGILDVAASSRPFAATAWFFHTVVRQSVTLRSIAIEAPPVDDAAMAHRGAGHYELVCAACHGSPARAPAVFARTMQPRPPPLLDQIEHWRPAARVFWTVKHGIRPSGMPAWPDQRRDDEVWDMVAFLRAMPDMGAARYARLSGHGEADICARCHGPAGEGPGSGLPRLDIQSPAYLVSSLRAFRDGERSSGIMRSVTAGLGDDAIAALGERYGRGVAIPAAGAATDALAAGERIALRGVPDRKVPACESCHGVSARPDWPRLAGQDGDYIANQLRLFKELGSLRGGAHASIMAKAALGLTDADIVAVAGWYGARSLPSN